MSNPKPAKRPKSPPQSAKRARPAPTPVPTPIAAPAPKPAFVRHSLGGIKEEMVPASTVPAVDLKTVLSDLPGNPFVYQRRVAQSLLSANTNIRVTQNLVNTLSGKPLTTDVNDKIKDVTTEESK